MEAVEDLMVLMMVWQVEVEEVEEILVVVPTQEELVGVSVHHL